ncbi:MAG: carbonate dehydratase [Chloroflexi bacterium]|nr:carbonate dehydratase [Chloroflexota bacterium]
MKTLNHLFEKNRQWANDVKKESPQFFTELSKQQKPHCFWIGCCDSRVPANQIIGSMPGDVFVHRNIANIVNSSDMNCMSALQYAVDVLQVEHVILCGHYGCGGVKAAVQGEGHDLIDYWIWDVKRVFIRYEDLLSQLSPDQGALMMCELNVIEQVYKLGRTKVVREAWGRGQSLNIHGWVYGLDNGLLQEVVTNITQLADVKRLYKVAVTAVTQKYLPAITKQG